MDAREIAARVLGEIEARARASGRTFSNRILGQELERHPALAARERGLATLLVYGVLRHRRRLDVAIDEVAHRPKALKGDARQIVRIAAYEILELDRPLPIAAAEAARATRRLDRSGHLARGVSGILRALSQRTPAREHGVIERELDEPLPCMVERWSIPPWLAARWIDQLGPVKALSRARALAATPSVDVRVDLSRLTRADALASLQADHPTAMFECPERALSCVRSRAAGDLFHGPLFSHGLLSVQSLGSQLVAPASGASPGDLVLDACCGMGGKTLHLIERMERRGRLIAVDADLSRLDELTRALAQRGLHAAPGLQVTVRQGDWLDGSSPGVTERADVVVIDAPCTGLGNLARHPELREAIAAEDLQHCAARQARLLARLALARRTGGTLVYAVCSLEPEEGPDVVRSAAAALSLQIEFEDRTTPEDDGCDGLYLARLR